MYAIRSLRSALILTFAVVLALIGSLAAMAAQPVVEDDPETREQLENIGLGYHLIDAVFNGHDSDTTATLVADNAVIATSSGALTGPNGLLEYVANIRDVYPDALFAVTSLSATNDSVVIAWKLTATQFAPDTSGRRGIFPVEMTGAFTVTVAGGDVTHMSTVSEHMVVAGPAHDDDADVTLDGPTLVGSGPERENVAAPDLADEPGSPDGLAHIAQAHQLFDAVFNLGDTDAAEALVTADAVIQTDYATYEGPEGLIDYVAFVKRSYPDAVFDVTSIEVRGDTLEVSWTMSGTRMVIDPHEPPVEMDLSRAGTMTLTIGDTGITRLSLQSGDLVTTTPDA